MAVDGGGEGAHFGEEGVFGIAFVVGFDFAGEKEFGVAGVGFQDFGRKGRIVISGIKKVLSAGC